MAFLDETGLAELWSLIQAEDVKHDKIAKGSYVGTGKYGSSNKNSLTFPFEPKVLIINVPYFSSNMYFWCPYVCGASQVIVFNINDHGIFKINVTVSGNTISWYLVDNVNAAAQMNHSGTTYHYVAIG